MRILTASLFALPFALFLACGGNEPAPNTPAGGGAASASAAPSGAPSAAPSAASTTPAAGALTPFDSLATKDLKVERMKTVVMPKVGKTFTDHDGAKYGNGQFTCKTCHGPNYQDPRKFLPKLKLSGDGFQKLMAAKPDTVKWMHEQIEPAMAEAMGEKAYDMKTNTGFGCKGCHGVE
jgi:cytochrome c553